MAQAMLVLRSLRGLGVTLPMDDYGTGQPSLAHLENLPVHEVEVDRSFVQGTTTDPGDAAVVRSTIDLAHQLGLPMVAEGVEDVATLDLLAAWGCDTVQGFHVSRPLAPDALTVRLTPAAHTPSRRQGWQNVDSPT